MPSTDTLMASVITSSPSSQARAPDADVQREKEWLKQEEPDAARHLALVVVHADAVAPANGSLTYGTYDLYVPPNLDDRIENRETALVHVTATYVPGGPSRDEITRAIRGAFPRYTEIAWAKSEGAGSGGAA